jgi:hypothetical protein
MAKNFEKLLEKIKFLNFTIIYKINSIASIKKLKKTYSPWWFLSQS